MENQPQKSKALIITIVVIIFLLIVGFFAYKNKSTIEIGVSNMFPKVFKPIDTTKDTLKTKSEWTFDQNAGGWVFDSTSKTWSFDKNSGGWIAPEGTPPQPEGGWIYDTNTKSWIFDKNAKGGWIYDATSETTSPPSSFYNIFKLTYAATGGWISPGNVPPPPSGGWVFRENFGWIYSAKGGSWLFNPNTGQWISPGRTIQLCLNGSNNPPLCTTTSTGSCRNGATNPPDCNRIDRKCLNGATNPPICSIRNNNICINGAINPPRCTTKTDGTCLNNGKNPPLCTINSDGECLNGTNNPPICTTIGPCNNGGINPPMCTINNRGVCINGGTNPPMCTIRGDGTCINGGDNPPMCTVINRVCINGASNPVLCTIDELGMCLNEGTNPPMCTIRGDGTCINGGDNPPMCTVINGVCINGGDNPPMCTVINKICINGASNPPLCTVINGVCINGATNPTMCTTKGDGTCINGGDNPPLCTVINNICINGGTNPPMCTINANGTCINGGDNPPLCTVINGKCINGATNPTMCTIDYKGICINGASNPPLCTVINGVCINGASNPTLCTIINGKCINGAINPTMCTIMPKNGLSDLIPGLVSFILGGGTQPSFSLTITKTGNGSGVVNSVIPLGSINCGTICTKTYSPNTVVTLNSQADAGSRFIGWSGSCTGNQSCIVTMSALKNVVATFNLVNTGNQTTTYTVTASATSTNGTITLNTTQSTDTVKVFTVIPNNGYTATVGGTCGGSLVGTTYTTTPLTFNCTVIASFNLISVTPPTGILDGSNCIIPSHGSSCTTTLNLTITNPNPAAATNITKPTDIEVASNITPASKPNIAVSYPGTTFYLNHGGNTLATKIVYATCDTSNNYNWNGNSCEIPVATLYTATAGATSTNGTITLNTTQSTDTVKVFTVIPNNGYTATVGGTCGGFLVGTTYTTTPLTFNCTVIASFNLNNTATPTGTLDGADCVIAAHRSSCNTTLTLTVTNPNGAAATNITKPTDIEVASNITPTSKPNIAVSYPGTTFYLNHGGNTLATKIIYATCDTANNYNWNGTSCETPTIPSAYTLTVSKIGTGDGTVNSTIPSGSLVCGTTCTKLYNPDTAVSLQATRNAGSTFYGWSGDCTGTGICTTTMNKAKTVTARFDIPIITITPDATSIYSGGNAMITWSTSPAASNCAISHNGIMASGYVDNDSAPSSGNMSTGSLTETTIYRADCVWPDGARATKTTQVTIIPVTATIFANPATIVSGNSSTLTWSSSPAASGCIIDHNGISTTNNASGNLSTDKLTTTTTYTINCFWPRGGKATSTTTIVVSPVVIKFPTIFDKFLELFTIPTAYAATTVNIPIDREIIFSATITNKGTTTTGSQFVNSFQIANAPNGGGTIETKDTLPMPALAVGEKGTTTVNYTFTAIGLYSVRVCADRSLSVNDTIIESNEGNNCGAWVNLSVTDPNLPPPGTPECSDKIDNEGDGLIDAEDPQCHEGGIIDAPYVATWDSESNNAPVTSTNLVECNDGIDNDGDKLIDSEDPGCHEGGNINNPYISTWDSESNPPPASAPINICKDIEQTPLEFTPEEKAKLDTLLRKFYLISSTLKTSDDITTIYDEIEQQKGFVAQTDALTKQCYLELNDRSGFTDFCIRNKNSCNNKNIPLEINPLTHKVIPGETTINSINSEFDTSANKNFSFSVGFNKTPADLTRHGNPWFTKASSGDFPYSFAGELGYYKGIWLEPYSTKNPTESCKVISGYWYGTKIGGGNCDDLNSQYRLYGDCYQASNVRYGQYVDDKAPPNFETNIKAGCKWNNGVYMDEAERILNIW